MNAATRKTMVLGMMLSILFTSLHAQECELEIDSVSYQGYGGEIILFSIYHTSPGYDTLRLNSSPIDYDLLFLTEENPLLVEMECQGIDDYSFVISDPADTSCFSKFSLENVACEGGSCDIDNIEIGNFSCNDDGTYDFVLDFIHTNTSDSFNVVDNFGADLGVFAYSQLPVTILSMETEETGYDAITVCDNAIEDCCQAWEWIGPECDSTSTECSLEASVLMSECDGPILYLDIALVCEGNVESVEIFGNGNEYGVYDCSDSLITLEIDVSNIDIVELIFQSTGDVFCQDIIEIDHICNQEECGFSQIQVYDFGCNENGTYDFLLNFIPEGTSEDGFDLFDAEGEFFGFYFYEDLPILVEQYAPGNTGADQLTICDNDNPDCCMDWEWLSPECSDSTDCHLLPRLLSSTCVDGELRYLFEVLCENTSGEYVITGNDEEYGEYNCGDTVIISFENGGQQAYEFIFTDVEQEACFSVLELDNPCLGMECGFSDIRVFDIECNEDGTYDFLLDFAPQNVENEFFDLIDHTGEIIGFYAYDDLPVLIEDFVSRDAEFDFLRICDNDNPDCCAEHEWRRPNCEDEDCEWDIAYISGECIEDTTVVRLSIACPPDVENFVVQQGNQIFGPFTCGDSLYEIVLGSSELKRLIFDIFIDSTEECFDRFFTPNPCVEDECTLGEIILEPHECDSNQMYFVDLDLSREQNVSDSFVLFINGEIYGIYSYEDLFLTIGPFDGSHDGIYEVVVVDQEQEDCFATRGFTSPCTNSECGLQADFLEAVCEDGFVSLQVLVTCGDANGFVVYYEGDSLGQYDCLTGRQLITIDLETNNTQTIDLIFEATNLEDCSFELNIEEPCESDCPGGGFEVETSQCRDGMSSVVISLDGAEEDESYEVYLDSEALGVFEGGDFPLVFGPFDGNGDSILITIAWTSEDSTSCELDYAAALPLCTTSTHDQRLQDIQVMQTSAGLVIRLEDQTLPLDGDLQLISSTGRLISKIPVCCGDVIHYNIDHLSSGIYWIYHPKVKIQKIAIVR